MPLEGLASPKHKDGKSYDFIYEWSYQKNQSNSPKIKFVSYLKNKHIPIKTWEISKFICNKIFGCQTVFIKLVIFYSFFFKLPAKSFSSLGSWELGLNFLAAAVFAYFLTISHEYRNLSSFSVCSVMGKLIYPLIFGISAYFISREDLKSPSRSLWSF